MNKKTNYDCFGKVINKVDKQVTALLANMTLEIYSTPSIHCSICTPANESSKSNDNTNQNDLQTEDENISEVTPFLNNTVCTPMISNEKNVSRKEDKQIKRVEAELAAVKSHLKCEIANMNSKIESISNSFVTSLNNFNDQLNNFNILKDNLNFLQKELEEKKQIIKTLMETQTTVLEFIANQNHNNSNRSSSTSHVNNSTTKDTQPIHESHSLKRQQQVHTLSSGNVPALKWQKTNVRGNQKVSPS